MWLALTSGFLMSLALIVAIGAQNAFVLRQGLLREHVFWVCLVCAVSDATLIALGVAGFGTIVDVMPWLDSFMRIAGATFLFWIGARSLFSAWKGTSSMPESTVESTGLKKTIATTLTYTWLNPHVYLDTVVFLGSVASQSDSKIAFATGAMTASFVFFFSLGFGARLLRPIFIKPRAWRIFDFCIGVLMWVIAVTLLIP